MRSLLLFLSLCALLAAEPAAAPASAPASSLAEDFTNSFGPITVAFSEGTLTLTRNKALVDAGADWRPAGKAVPLDAEHDSVTIVPVAALNGGYYQVNILFFGADGQFIAEVPLVLDTNSSDPCTVGQVGKLAAAKAPGAASYFIRFRIQPVDQAGAAFSFRGVSAGPAKP